MTTRSSMRLFENKASPMLCKDYLNIPVQVFRNGQYVNIAEHNRKQAINGGPNGWRK